MKFRLTGSEGGKARAARHSTKQTNKRTAELMQALAGSLLQKGGWLNREKPVPTLARFAEESFLPFVRATKAEKLRTISFYEPTVRNLNSVSKLANLPLDRINSGVLGEYAAICRAQRMKVSTVNRELATVRRIFNLAAEWGEVIRLPREDEPSESQRIRVLTAQEEEP